MKKVTLVKATEVEVKPFHLSDLGDQQRDKSGKERISKERITKKTVKRLAKEIGLSPSDEELVLAKKLLEAYLAKR